MLYDGSRICTRALNATPNGIDRLDALLARTLLTNPEGPDGFAPSTLVFGLGGPRILPARDGIEAVDRAERTWREIDSADRGGRALNEVRARIANPVQTSSGRASRRRILATGAGRRIRSAIEALRRVGLSRGDDPVLAAPRRSVLLNASHFPLDWPSHVAWLDRRPDVRLVMLVHDLLPLDHPEMFWPGEPKRHQARLGLLARRGAAAIVTSQSVADRLRDELARAGRHDLPVLQAFPPVSPVFRPSVAGALPASGRPYFVACGTIEPRKNHWLLLRVWRRLVAEEGAAAPSLVVVGKRGWLCKSILEEMADPALAGHVVEVSRLSSRDYKTLLDGSVALLAPSLAEGFGLPVAEALSSGIPVVASDIAPFREQAESAAIFLSPTAERLWLEAITALSKVDGDERKAALARTARYRPVAETEYLETIRGFVGGLA